MGAQIQHFGIVCCTMDFRERGGATLSECDNEMRKAIVDARESEKTIFVQGNLCNYLFIGIELSETVIL